jgi:hypothetical protein
VTIPLNTIEELLAVPDSDPFAATPTVELRKRLYRAMRDLTLKVRGRDVDTPPPAGRPAAQRPAGR